MEPFTSGPRGATPRSSWKSRTTEGEFRKTCYPGLFEPTFRAEGGRITTANWGLFVSRGVITEHGGHVEIESEEGTGTTARIRLPASR